MKTQISASMMNYIFNRAAKTLARCWKVTTVGGQVFGFTSHTRTFIFEGVTYNSLLGFSSSAIQSKEGLSPDNLSVTTFLSQQDELDIYKGVYDHARVEIFLINYLDLSMSKIIEKTGFIGQITRSDGKFTAEIEGLSKLLSVKVGKTYTLSCNARLGDNRCKVNIGPGGGFYTTGVVSSVMSRKVFTATLGGSFPSGWFTEGTVEFTSGTNSSIKRDIVSNVDLQFEFFIEPPFPMVNGDMFNITAGCVKSLAACREKFNNVTNHRGFPFVPTVEIVYSSPISSTISIQQA